MIKSEDLVLIISSDIKDDLLRGQTLAPSYIEVEYPSNLSIIIEEIEGFFNAFVKELMLFPSVNIYFIRIRDEHEVKHEYLYIVNRVTKRAYLVRDKAIFYDWLISKYNDQEVAKVFAWFIDNWLEQHCEKINL